MMCLKRSIATWFAFPACVVLMISTAPTFAVGVGDVSGCELPLVASSETKAWAQQFLRLVRFGIQQKLISLEDIERVVRANAPGSPLEVTTGTPANQELRKAFGTLIAAQETAVRSWARTQRELSALLTQLQEGHSVRQAAIEETKAALIEVRDYSLGEHLLDRVGLVRTPEGRVFVFGIEMLGEKRRHLVFEPLKSPEPVFSVPVRGEGFGAEVAWHMTGEGQLLAATYSPEEQTFFVYEPLNGKKIHLRYPARDSLTQITWTNDPAGEALLVAYQGRELRVFSPLGKGLVWSYESVVGDTKVVGWHHGREGQAYIHVASSTLVHHWLHRVGEGIVWGESTPYDLEIDVLPQVTGSPLLAVAEEREPFCIFELQKGGKELWKSKSRLNDFIHEIKWMRAGERTFLAATTRGGGYLFEPFAGAQAPAEPIFHQDPTSRGAQLKFHLVNQGHLPAESDIYAIHRYPQGDKLRTTVFRPVQEKTPLLEFEEIDHTGNASPAQVYFLSAKKSELALAMANLSPDPSRRLTVHVERGDPASLHINHPIGTVPDKFVTLVHRPGGLLLVNTDDNRTWITEYLYGGAAK